jgi:DNA-binding beta-propeller fold protein YncE
MKLRSLAALSGPVVLLGACSSGGDLPTAPPTTVTRVAQGGFENPTDAIASPDGATFYFGGFTTPDGEPAVFRTAASPNSTAEVLVTGDPLGLPIGLVAGCDGGTIYVADAGSEEGVLFALAAGGGALTSLGAAEMIRPAGLAMGPDCATLYVTGRTLDGVAALFSIPTAGGAATVVYQGAPLESPTGVHVDDDGVAWVMDHDAFGEVGQGVLFAIPSDGSSATVVADDLRMGTPGGVSLTAGGGTAVMPTKDRLGNTQLTAVDIATKQVTQLATPDILAPAGLRTARGAGVFAIADADGDAIYLGQ